MAPSSKFVGHSAKIIRQSKIKGPLTTQYFGSACLLGTQEMWC